MLRKLILTLLLCFAYTNSFALADGCVPKSGNGKTLVEIIDGSGKVVYAKEHKINEEDKYKGFVSDTGVSLILRKKENESKLNLKSSIHIKAKGAYVKASRKDGAAVAIIGGCPIREISLLSTFKKTKEPFIHGQVIVYAMNENTNTSYAAPSNTRKPNVAVTNSQPIKPSSTVVTGTSSNIQKATNVGNKDKGSYSAFGIPFGVKFSPSSVKKILKEERTGADKKVYTVVPKINHPYFTQYVVETYESLGGLVSAVGAYTEADFCNVKNVCREKVNAVVASLKKKYGDPYKLNKSYKDNIPYDVKISIGNGESYVPERYKPNVQPNRLHLTFGSKGKSNKYVILYEDNDSKYLREKLNNDKEKQRQEEIKKSVQTDNVDTGL